MVPTGYGSCTLEKLTPVLRERPDDEVWDPTPGIYRAHGIPVDVWLESSDQKLEDETSFMTYWKPSWRDVVRMVFGGRIRVSVNYSMGGPLDLDVVSADDAMGAAIASRLLEW